ncbi:MAG: hypothetical protein MR006_07260 [Arcanobacterium sp.]|nr:hypothetical protein [Arcanobacterium sp.]MDY5589399.1 NifB/NifX family molybdenum-iron cluster-binding protein [Arcanobacterium sp.]
MNEQHTPTSDSQSTAAPRTAPSTPVVVAINVIGDSVGAGLGRAHSMAVATVADGAISEWKEYEVNWDTLHDTGPEGTHHGRIVRFLREHGVNAVITGHAGPPMVNTMSKLGVLPLLGAAGPARDAALAGAQIWLEQQR